MKTKKVKPNLIIMFNFHTIILVMLVVVVSTLHKHTIEGKLQTSKHHHHHHTQNYKQHNNVGGIDTDMNGNVANKLEQPQHGHHNHQHSQHYHHHQHHPQPHQPPYTTTPSLEFTTSSSASSSASASLNIDNEFLIKQQELPLTNKDDIYYKTKDLKSSLSSFTSSTTTKPSLSIQLMKQHVVGNMKTSSSNTSSTMLQSETLSNSRREHTHLNYYNSNSNRLISTPSTKQQASGSGDDGGGIDNNRSDTIATMYSDSNENSKLNLARAQDNDDTKLNETAKHQNQSHNDRHHHHYRDHEHDQKKPEFHKEQQPAHQNYEDYYSDAEDDDADDDDYNEDENDNDNIDGNSYDDDNNLSDRSYARITRSKLDDDYIDDEPYRNGLNELSMQRDAPGVLTEQKYLEVGNEKAVQQARERFIQEKRPRTPHELATEHWHRMIQATKCRKPLPRVIPVSNNTSKRYEPYATILHRCGDDTGCCGSTASVCTVKRHEIVMVYVFSYDFNYRKEIEALPMQNHTECHCVNRGSLLHDSMPRDKRSGGSGAGGGLGSTTYLQHFQRQQRNKQQQQQQHRQSQSQSQQLQLQSHHQQQLQNMLDCHCPRHFNVFEEDVERHAHLPKPHSVFIRKCRCDCLVNNQTCLRFKHGEEGFSLEDRKCILERNCKPPVCSYGEYDLRVGRCPSYYRSHLHLQTT